MPRPPANLTLSDDDVLIWKNRIEQGEKRVKEWREKTASYRAAYHSEYPQPCPDEDEGEQVRVNRVKRVVTQWKSTIYAQNPTITLRPPWRKKEGDQKKADINAAIYNLDSYYRYLK